MTVLVDEEGDPLSKSHEEQLFRDITNMVSTKPICQSFPKNLSLSSTRVKPLPPIIQRVMKYEAQMQVNISKLRMFRSSFGRGICTAELISFGHAVCEYSGKLISKAAAEQLSEVYSQQGKGCFMFDFKLDDGRVVCMDATAEDGKPGRLLNHSFRKGNLKAVKIEIGEMVRLFFVATKTITANRELLFDYGDRSGGTESFLRKSPSPSYVRPSSFCGSFSLSQVLVSDS
jgi:SET domain